jgi:hypothetical protein
MKLQGVAAAPAATHAVPDALAPSEPSDSPDDALLASLGVIADERALIRNHSA